jgi:hypothetical protein
MLYFINNSIGRFNASLPLAFQAGVRNNTMPVYTNFYRHIFPAGKT